MTILCGICGAEIADIIPAMFAGVCLDCARAMSCWRCGEGTDGFWPYFLCEPCVDVVSGEDLAWLNDPENQPDAPSWRMTPLGKPQGRLT